MASILARHGMLPPGEKAPVSNAGDGIFYTGHIVYTTVSFMSIMILSILLSKYRHIH